MRSYLLLYNFLIFQHSPAKSVLYVRLLVINFPKSNAVQTYEAISVHAACEYYNYQSSIKDLTPMFGRRNVALEQIAKQ